MKNITIEFQKGAGEGLGFKEDLITLSCQSYDFSGDYLIINGVHKNQVIFLGRILTFYETNQRDTQ